MPEVLMSVKDVAAYLGLSERTVYSMIKRAEIPYLRVGGQYRFDHERVDQWLQQTSKAQSVVSLDKVRETADPLTKRLLFMGLLTRELDPENVIPIIVGGNAVEFYTAGGYATQDIDVVAPSEPLDIVLKKWGFAKKGRHWISEKLGIVIEAPARSLDREEQYEKLYEVEIEGLRVYILGIEDLIVDRLNAYVHWGSLDDKIWARELMVLHAGEIDWDYLKKRAKEEKVNAALSELEKEFEESEKG